MNNPITMKLNADELILQALREDITSEDITTNAVMPKPCEGQVDLICKQDGILAGIDVFRRVFELLDENTQTEAFAKDGDPVKKGMKAGDVDPRDVVENCHTVSDKARAVGGGVLEAILALENRMEKGV